MGFWIWCIVWSIITFCMLVYLMSNMPGEHRPVTGSDYFILGMAMLFGGVFGPVFAGVLFCVYWIYPWWSESKVRKVVSGVFGFISDQIDKIPQPDLKKFNPLQGLVDYVHKKRFKKYEDKQNS